jgi:DNA-binding CsgD family transcriptional regulator
VADLLREVPERVLDELPDIQRVAVDHVLMRATAELPATDQHVVAAAFNSVVRCLATDSPVLIAIDNVQWLDPSSQAITAFAARRFAGSVGLLMTERCDPDCGSNASWLQLTPPDALNRIRMGPLSLGALHALFSTRLGRIFPRPTMVRIAEIFGGNPFYALELARAIDTGSTAARPVLPGSLATLMRQRIGRLERDAQEMLLAAASVADPTVELLAQVTDTSVDHAADLLEEAESKALVSIDGHRVRFSHPLLARTIYTDASPARRRAVHRQLADALLPPEMKARHMALAASSANPETLQALDSAATSAAARGAPAAAAELVDLGLRLGGDEPPRRLRAAEYHFKAGDAQRAQALLERTIDQLPPGMLRGAGLNLMAAVRLNDDNWTQAASLLERALAHVEGTPAFHVNTLISLAFTQWMVAKFDESLATVRTAVSHAEALGDPALISVALAMSVQLNFMAGNGVDEASLRRAVELEDPDADVLLPFRASVVNALVLAWTGRLDEACTHLAETRNRCVEGGNETDLMAVTSLMVLVEVWRGDLAEAVHLADEAMERAEQGGGTLAFALTMRAMVAAYVGREHDTRADVHAALDIARRRQSPRLIEWPLRTLGFLEVSLGNYAEAVSALQPLLREFEANPGTEIAGALFLPDAIEALASLGRHTEAEPLIEALEGNGRRNDCAWMLAVGARCRSMSLAARGDVDAAELMARQALIEHDRIPIRFERARTELLLGQLQRRQRRKDTATATLKEALATFEDIGTPFWADRARAELARTNVVPSRDVLTPSERRVAELAASGKTNRDVASALFISPKTVEANLARIYRKLGIKSRAELGRLFGDSESIV